MGSKSNCVNCEIAISFSKSNCTICNFVIIAIFAIHFTTLHQAVIIKHKSQTPSLKSTDDDLDKPSSSSSSDEEKPVFEEKEKKPVKKVLALKEMKEKEAKIDKLEDQIDDLKKVLDYGSVAVLSGKACEEGFSFCLIFGLFFNHVT